MIDDNELENLFRLTRKNQWNFFSDNVVSEQFIENHIDLIKESGWKSISLHQNISVDFIAKNFDNINFGLLQKNNAVNQDLLEKGGVYVYAKLRGKNFDDVYYTP
jgi:hypothetical protein